jgi:hypothetical protein
MTRPRRARARSDDLSDVAWALLTDQPVPKRTEAEDWEAFALKIFDEQRGPVGKPSLLELWEANRQAILEEWAEIAPGTRPSLWWRWDAPRSPVGTWPGWHVDGKVEDPRRRIGEPLGARLYGPECRFGIPLKWVQDPDPRDPPAFEAQASYLKRHGLFLPGEEKRLQKADFAPDIVVYVRDDE